MLYSWKVRALKIPRINAWWRRLVSRRGQTVGSYGDLPSYIRRFAPGKSFADVGCLWGVDGEYAFFAEESGATQVKAVDVFGPTPEFEEKKTRRRSRVEFILGDITSQRTIHRIGVVDVVFCAGVLYHHPSPFDLLVALRRICRQTLILRSSTIPEVRGLKNVAVFWPMMDERSRDLWSLRSLGVQHQAGISDEFRPGIGYGNWFWGLTPSCLESLLETAGFRVEQRATEAFAQTVVCAVTSTPFEHRLPDETAARAMGEKVSVSGIARPA
jgi:hypothetical protein